MSRESYRMHSGLPGDSLFPPVWASPSADEVSGAGQGHTAADCMRTAGSGTNPKGWWWPVPRVVIACQGGGSHTAFTAGVLRRMLGSQELAGYEIAGLSGTSGGAVCALLAWYALRDDDPALAGSLLEQFWIGNSARMPADALLNTWILWAGAWQDLGVTPPAVSPYHTPAAAIGAEQFRLMLRRQVDFGRIDVDTAGRHPVLLIGAVDVLSGEFRTFSSRRDPISADTVLASAAIPNLFRAVKVGDGTYWDGLFSQNPPVRELLDARPDEIGRAHV